MTYTKEKADRYIEINKHTIHPSHRHGFHMMAPVGWVNDPNGFSHFNGEYHLFYQHYPYKAEWGPMHWGHATSDDLIQWRHMPVALAPDMPYDKGGCFSGTAMSDSDTLDILYTGHTDPDPDDPKAIRQVQCLATSVDGKTFHKHEGNPVIGSDALPSSASVQDFRDPKLFKHDGTYYAIVGSRHTDGSGQLLMFTSDDKVAWKYHSTLMRSKNAIGKMWECPDYIAFEESDVLLLSPQFLEDDGHRYTNVHASLYMVGDLDFKAGRFDHTKIEEIDSGLDFYAPQTVRTPDGRVIMVAWMQMWDQPMPIQEHGWAGSMTLPRELTLKDGVLYQTPVENIRNYRRNPVHVENERIEGRKAYEGVSGTRVDMELSVCFVEESTFKIELFKDKTSRSELIYDASDETMTLRRNIGSDGPKGERTIPVPLSDGTLEMRIILDTSSLELFMQNGRHAMSSTVFPNEGADGIVFDAEKPVTIRRLDHYAIEVE